LDKSQNSERASGEARGRGGLAMTNRDRAELQVAAVIGAVLGGVTGYLLSYLVESGGWLKILIWALIGAVVVTGMVFCLRALRS
jgi:FtsH-binding integral membrane protein